METTDIYGYDDTMEMNDFVHDDARSEISDETSDEDGLYHGLIDIPKTEAWGDACIPLSENSGVLRIYCQNVSGIFDSNGIG